MVNDYSGTVYSREDEKVEKNNNQKRSSCPSYFGP
jgi:hypothetical protein